MWFCCSAIGRIPTNPGSPSLRPRPTRSAISRSTATWRRPAAACSRWATSPIPRIHASRPRSGAERLPRERSRSGWRARAQRHRDGAVRDIILVIVVPAKAGTHILEKVGMGPRFRGDERILTPASALRLRLQDAPRHRVELLQKLLVARLRRGDQRGVERAIRTDGTGLVL